MSSINTGVYYNSPVCRWHLDKFKNLSTKDWILYDDVNLFVRSTQPKNIAVLHWPYPYDPTFRDLVNRIYDFCSHIYILASELHQPTVEFIRDFDREKITYYVAGTLTDPPRLATMEPWMDWFITTRSFYRDYLPEIVSRINYTQPKRMMFDILLGRKKLHRECIYNYVKANLDRDLYVMRYFNDPSKKDVTNDYEYWIQETRGLKIVNPVEWTVDKVEYYGNPMSLSQIIPIELYNQTAYSVVAETNWASTYQFFTEKTVKPIIGRRLFLMVAGKGYLQALRDMGFKTFDGVIDESYDTMDDDLFRFDAVGQQIAWLAQQDQSTILEKIRPIVEHNYAHLMSRDWYGEFSQHFEQSVLALVQQTQNLQGS